MAPKASGGKYKPSRQRKKGSGREAVAATFSRSVGKAVGPKGGWNPPSPMEWVFDGALLGSATLLWYGRQNVPAALALFISLLLLFFIPWFAISLMVRNPVKPWVWGLTGLIGISLVFQGLSIPARCDALETGEKIRAFFVVCAAVLFVVGIVNGFAARDRERDRKLGKADGDGDMGVDQVLAALALGLLPMFFLFLHNPWQSWLDKKGAWGTLTAVLLSIGIFLGGIAAVILVFGVMKGARVVLEKTRAYTFFPWGGHLIFPLTLGLLWPLFISFPVWPLTAITSKPLLIFCAMTLTGLIPFRLVLISPLRKWGWVSGSLAVAFFAVSRYWAH